MTPAAILALIQAGEMSVPAIIAAWEKWRQTGGPNITLQQAIDDAHKNNADTVAAMKAMLGI
jgi:hypothetical protein